jgi:hypothetical protein
MKLTRIVPIAAAALISLAPNAFAGTSHRSYSTVTLYPENPVVFGDPTTACPEGVITFAVVNAFGLPAGTGVNCIQSVTFDEVRQQQVLESDSTIQLVTGTLRAHVISTEALDFGADVHVIHESYRGTIAGGTGIYRNAHGTFMGGGTLETQNGAVIDVEIAYVYQFNA